MFVVARIVRSLAAYNRPPQARLLRARRSVVCVIATNVAPHELLWRPNRRTRFVVMAVLFTTVSLGCNGGHSIRLAYSRETGGRPKVPLEIRQLDPRHEPALRTPFVFAGLSAIVVVANGLHRSQLPPGGPGGCHSCAIIKPHLLNTFAAPPLSHAIELAGYHRSNRDEFPIFPDGRREWAFQSLGASCYLG